MEIKDVYWTGLDRETTDALDEWRRAQKVIPSRRAAVRAVLRGALAQFRSEAITAP